MADGITIEIKGVKELQNKFNGLKQEIWIAFENELKTSAELVRDAAKEHVHVISEDLKNSIEKKETRITSDHYEVEVGSSLHYAEVEEFRVGGKYPGSHSYMRWALDTKEPEIKNKIETRINGIITRYR